jgi:hypothetical protein
LNTAEHSGDAPGTPASEELGKRKPFEVGHSSAPDQQLDGWNRSRWPEWTAFSLFAALVALAIPYHEPWADEAQGWQLARSLSLTSLFRTYIRYEASPGLWHFILWILIRLHVTYAGMHWFCGAVGLAASALLIFRSPFPRYLRFTLPFTYFLLFQYAVIARSYVLAPLLLFLVAMRWRRSPIQVALLLGLLANVSLHAAAISGGLAVVYCIEQTRGESGKRNAMRRQLIIGALILVGLYGFALWTAWPPHDLLVARFRGQSRPFLVFSLGSLVYAVCEPWILSIPFWIAIALCLGARRALIYLLPVVFFALFCGVVYAQFWHLGLLVPLVIALLWITWPEDGQEQSKFETAGRAALLVMASIQILWSGFALQRDHYHAFSGDLAAARFLEPFVHENARIDVSWANESDAHAFDAVGILPYFDRNIYENQDEPFWWWSENNPIERRFNELLPTRPRIVLVETRVQPGMSLELNQPEFKRLTAAGYRLTNSFCGTMPIRLELGLTSCHLIFQPVEDAPAAGVSPAGVGVGNSPSR